jgi:predicted acetylornithine/succinylornithine family transaminase
MDSRRIAEETDLYVMHTYRRFPICLRKGLGTRVWSVEGREYLDFVGGIATDVLGHCHPGVVVAIQKQAQRLLHVSNLYHIEPQTRLAKLLVENSFASKVFFCNSGAEAAEAAIKLARKYSRENHLGTDRYEIVTALKSFHGRTMGALSATGQEKFQTSFTPLLPGFVHVRYGDVEELHKAITHRTCAVFLEPIVGEGGVIVPPPEYLREVRALCDEHNLLLMLDEVQTGMGRTGLLFAYEHSGIAPDIMTLAKGLGGGVPIGAMLATEKVARAFEPGDHGATFGGNPLVTAAAIATLETVLDSGFILDQCRRMGEHLMARLGALRGEFPNLIVDVRGMGLLVGMELTRDCAPIVAACMDQGLLINCTAGNVLRFMPPLIVQESEIDQAMDILEGVLDRRG